MTKRAISLLVHEQCQVVVDQCRNFETFSSDTIIMIHVSPSSNFTAEELSKSLIESGLNRCFINPKSVPTQWGRIIGAHLSNIEELAKVCEPDTIVSFHASNDMLLLSLPSLDHGASLYEAREVSRTSLWSVGRACARSPTFSTWSAMLGCPEAIGSQIEGSAFPLGMLAELAARIAALPEILDMLPAIAEEIVFATYAHNHLGPASGLPYVLVRPSIINTWPSLITPRPLRATTAGELLVKVIRRLSGPLNPAGIDPADVEAIIAGKSILVPGWPHGLPPQHSRQFHAIKRIERRFDDPLRVRIRAHTETFNTGIGRSGL